MRIEVVHGDVMARRSALEQGRAAARSLLDPEPPAVALVPRFWSALGELRIQVCGERPEAADEQLTLTRPGRLRAARAGVLVSYTIRGRPVGLVAINASAAFASGMRELVAATAVAWIDTRQDGHLKRTSVGLFR